MRHYGERPPWEGRSEHYGSWIFKAEESWLGTEVYWEWLRPSPPPGATLAGLVKVLETFYIPPVTQAFSREASLLEQMAWTGTGPMTAEQSKARRKRRWWRR